MAARAQVNPRWGRPAVDAGAIGEPRPYTNGLAIMEDPPLVDKEGYLNLPQGPGLDVTIKKDLIV